MSTRGTLFVVATPIGNLEDLSPRAIAVLRSASAIYCEDTRVTGKLAARFGLSAPRISCHAHNETARVAGLLERLQRGESVALVSDAGTPALSDPGQHAVAAAANAGHAVVAVPGPSAAAAALSISGLPAVPHLFAGFPPAKPGARRAFFERLAPRSETIVYFEAPHRLAASLADAAAVFGTRRAVVARELTKIHEEALRGTLADIRDRLSARGSVLGECVVVIEGAGTTAPSATPEDIDEAIDRLESEGLSGREISKRVARASGVPARAIYERILRRKNPPASE
jgi:16S rRNA (cytidine1402-2'-O)-methyltransferase